MPDQSGRPQLHVVVTSTRPGRVGLPVGQWFDAVAREHGGFAVRFVDLAEIDLPLVDEPNHPRLAQYTHAHTRAWSEIVSAADAFAFVTPEYNYGFNAPFKNAVDYLFHEWAYKPAGFVSYGGVSGGLRGVQMAKQVLTTLKVMPITEAVSVPFVAQFIDDDGTFRPNDVIEASATAMLDELVRWAGALAVLREPAAGAG